MAEIHAPFMLREGASMFITGCNLGFFELLLISSMQAFKKRLSTFGVDNVAGTCQTRLPATGKSFATL